MAWSCFRGFFGEVKNRPYSLEKLFTFSLRFFRPNQKNLGNLKKNYFFARPWVSKFKKDPAVCENCDVSSHSKIPSKEMYGSRDNEPQKEQSCRVGIHLSPVSSNVDDYRCYLLTI